MYILPIINVYLYNFCFAINGSSGMPTPTIALLKHIVGEGVLDLPQTIIKKPFLIALQSSLFT